MPSKPNIRQVAENQSAILRSLQPGDALADSEAPTETPEDVAIEAEIIEEPDGTSTAVAVPAQPTFEVDKFVPANHPAMRALNEYMTMRIDSTAGGEAAVADIIGQVLNAESVDDVLSDVEAQAWGDWLDVPVRLIGVKYNQSAYEAGAPWFAVCEVERLDNGWSGVVTIGAQTVLAQLVRLAQLNAYPAVVKLTRATKKPTKDGYWPLKLAKVS